MISLLTFSAIAIAALLSTGLSAMIVEMRQDHKTVQARIRRRSGFGC